MTTTTATLDALRSGELKGITRLDLACDLQEFPREIFELADSLEVLNLSGNSLSALPDDLPRLGKLRVIFCSENRFTQLPEVLSSCPQLEMVGFKANSIREVAATAISPGLRWLILTDNQVSALPDSIGSCTRLQKLMLAGNQLAVLPEAMRGCVGLELLRISANRFNVLPDWLLQLPRLTWLAFGGNPVSAAPHPPSAAVARLQWADIELGEKLGEGASGVIHKAHWQPSPQEAGHPVAVKLFKGAVTSDGFPAEEMAACLAAGNHAHLIGVIGELTGHPAGTSGLVMPWVDPWVPQSGRPAQSGDLHEGHLRERATFLPGLGAGYSEGLGRCRRAPARPGDFARGFLRAQRALSPHGRLLFGGLRGGLLLPASAKWRRQPVRGAGGARLRLFAWRITGAQ